MPTDEFMPSSPADDVGMGTRTDRLPELKEGQPPPEGDPRVGMWVWNNFLIARKAKEKGNWHAKWLRNHELVRGKHWKNRDPARSKYPLVPVNLFQQVHSTTKANLTDRRPKFDITPHSEQAKGKVPIIHAAANMWWKRTGQQKLLSATVNNSEKYGTTIEKMLFNQSLESGKGEIETVVVDPFKFFPWPGIEDIQRMPMFFEADDFEISEIKRIWPDTSKDVQGEKEWSKLFGKDREDVRGGSISESKHSDNLPNNWTTGDGKDIRIEGIKRAMIVECFLRDYTMEDIMDVVPLETLEDGEPLRDEDGEVVPQIDDDGKPLMQKVGEKPKYPGFIRVIHVTNNGKIVLDDIPNPSINPNLPEEVTQNTYLYDKFPHIKGESYSDDTNFWKYSIVEQIEILVLEINKKVSQIAAHIDRTVRPPLIIPRSAGIHDHEISNLPGQKWKPTNHIASQHIRYMQVPSLPTDFYKYLELLLKLVDVISGIHDVTEGRKPAGVTAASAIMALQEKAETIFREKIRNLDLLIEERGRMYLSLSQNWRTSAQTIQMSGKDISAFTEFPEFTGQDIPPDNEYSFEVVAGSTMPKSMFAMREQAIQLYQSGAIDQREILTVFEWPRMEEVVQRMAQGPLGQLLERMETAGVEPNVLELVEYIGSMDDNEFKQNFGQQPGPLGGTQIASSQPRSTA
jgi:hypothetical protein